MEDWEFIVLACDGIWDVMSNAEVLEFCRTRIGMGMFPEEICEELMNHCLAPDCQMGGLGGDNMTVVLVCLLHGRPYSDLIARCRNGSQATNNDQEEAGDATKDEVAKDEAEAETDTETETQTKPCQKQSNSGPMDDEVKMASHLNKMAAIESHYIYD